MTEQETRNKLKAMAMDGNISAAVMLAVIEDKVHERFEHKLDEDFISIIDLHEKARLNELDEGRWLVDVCKKGLESGTPSTFKLKAYFFKSSFFRFYNAWKAAEKPNEFSNDISMALSDRKTHYFAFALAFVFQGFSPNATPREKWLPFNNQVISAFLTDPIVAKLMEELSFLKESQKDNLNRKTVKALHLDGYDFWGRCIRGAEDLLPNTDGVGRDVIHPETGWSSLHYAAANREDDYVVLKTLLDDGFQITQTDDGVWPDQIVKAYHPEAKDIISMLEAKRLFVGRCSEGTATKRRTV